MSSWSQDSLELNFWYHGLEVWSLGLDINAHIFQMKWSSILQLPVTCLLLNVTYTTYRQSNCFALFSCFELCWNRPMIYCFLPRHIFRSSNMVSNGVLGSDVLILGSDITRGRKHFQMINNFDTSQRLCIFRKGSQRWNCLKKEWVLDHPVDRREDQTKKKIVLSTLTVVIHSSQWIC